MEQKEPKTQDGKGKAAPISRGEAPVDPLMMSDPMKMRTPATEQVGAKPNMRFS